MMPLWHDGPLAALDWDGQAPVAWRTQATAGARAGRMQALVAHLSGCAAEDVRLARTAAGAPRVASPGGWHVSLSHRGEVCLIGAALQPIAVDHEPVDAAPPLWDMLTDEEAAELRAVPPAAQSRGWLRRWTIKEAHAKLIGTPRRIAPEAIRTRLHDASRATARFEGISRCWTRDDGGAIETIALWAAA
ncbi:4'-phosphopantetheinyl transferase family protein [Sphingomonas sp. RIT328]|uniref:4'-phosphopantetheinyl transferase family protein n=1 Tax=Sphingomonas sp. RIT328 TaxID=1470591 RepID=UPI00044DC28A|nr:4'-phosphopantetheinyl transferase superfamily protein [Sphingomonas sp. RIT328]EZP48710.1 4'-phosphopantetheinyl transferase superfamily protein [Sphingomonas sp. RIT328]